jgi:hypothetical protein
MAPSRVEHITEPLPATKQAVCPSSSLEQQSYNDWRDDFFRDGYVVIPGAISQQMAAEYQSEALSWLEGFNLGFDRNDKTTWKKENLPQSWKGGMYLHYSAAHEKYVWDVRW